MKTDKPLPLNTYKQKGYRFFYASLLSPAPEVAEVRGSAMVLPTQFLGGGV